MKPSPAVIPDQAVSVLKATSVALATDCQEPLLSCTCGVPAFEPSSCEVTLNVSSPSTVAPALGELIVIVCDVRVSATGVAVVPVSCWTRACRLKAAPPPTELNCGMVEKAVAVLLLTAVQLVPFTLTSGLPEFEPPNCVRTVKVSEAETVDPGLGERMSIVQVAATSFVRFTESEVK